MGWSLERVSCYGDLIPSRGCIPVNFAVVGIIASTFVGRLYSGGSCTSSSSVSMNIQCIDFPWRCISGR